MHLETRRGAIAGFAARPTNRLVILTMAVQKIAFRCRDRLGVNVHWPQADRREYSETTCSRRS